MCGYDMFCLKLWKGLSAIFYLSYYLYPAHNFCFQWVYVTPCYNKAIIWIICSSDYRAIAGSGKVGPLNLRLTTTVGWLVAPTGRPKSVRYSCEIERICSVFVSFHLCIVCRFGVFVIRLRHISSFFFLTWLSVLYAILIVQNSRKYIEMFEVHSPCS